MVVLGRYEDGSGDVSESPSTCFHLPQHRGADGICGRCHTRPGEAMSYPSYDTHVGIAAQLGSLGDFLDLAQERSHAGYRRRERLNQWVVLGRYLFDTCGNLGILVEDERRIAFDPRRVEPVLTSEAFHTPERGTVSFAMCGRHPTTESRCVECDMGWEIESLHDHVMVRLATQDDPVFCHRECNRARLFKRDRDEFLKAFSDAGFAAAELRLVPIPNPSDYADIRGPAFVVFTPVGALKAWWRKSVCVLDWSRTGRNLEHVFAEERATKDEHMIHAYPGDIVRLLTKIREALS